MFHFGAIIQPQILCRAPGAHTSRAVLLWGGTCRVLSNSSSLATVTDSYLNRLSLSSSGSYRNSRGREMGNPLVTAALEYEKRGFSIVPLKVKDKLPLVQW